MAKKKARKDFLDLLTTQVEPEVSEDIPQEEEPVLEAATEGCEECPCENCDECDCEDCECVDCKQEEVQEATQVAEELAQDGELAESEGEVKEEEAIVPLKTKPSETNRKFFQMKREKPKSSQKYLGRRTRW